MSRNALKGADYSRLTGKFRGTLAPVAFNTRHPMISTCLFKIFKTSSIGLRAAVSPHRGICRNLGNVNTP